MNKGKIRKILFPMYRLGCSVLYYVFGKVYMYHVEIPITQKCTLKCKDCSFMIPYLAKHNEYSLNEIITAIDNLFKYVDKIHVLRVLGGEPFLHKDIGKILEYLSGIGKVDVIDVVTNGTIIPSDETLEVIKNNKIRIQISDYGGISDKKDVLVAECKKLGIDCVVRNYTNGKWLRNGNLNYRYRTEMQLRKQLKKCACICRSYQKGKLFFCPRMSFGSEFGIKMISDEGVDLMQSDNYKTVRKAIYKLNGTKMLKTCNFCDEGTENCELVNPAIQISNAEELSTWKSKE